MDAPRTRYKVVERGRRLEVVDTWNGNAPVRPFADPAPAPRRDLKAAARAVRRSRVERTSASTLDQRGARLLHTKPWYDDKGPRQIAVSLAGQEKLKGLRIVAVAMALIGMVLIFFFWPLLFILPFLLMNEATQKNLRAASTRFLDELNQPGNGYPGA
ncbi:hypothetical protein [Sphingomonas soli]|uniref:hypothetical protein n=1 Tax=Sphingomonas soli TaxID=266127 RepID=UPI000829B421|nr:hypothetical protein [Sphingomonas soli]